MYDKQYLVKTIQYARDHSLPELERIATAELSKLQTKFQTNRYLYERRKHPVISLEMAKRLEALDFPQELRPGDWFYSGLLMIPFPHDSEPQIDWRGPFLFGNQYPWVFGHTVCFCFMSFTWYLFYLRICYFPKGQES